jgi:two-component system invasion response regulator UvrY
VAELINIVLVDDHKLVRTGIRRLLEDVSGIKVVGEASNGEEAIQLIRQLKPAVVLMDIKMPGISGLETTRKLLRLDSDLKIIIITAYENDIFPVRLMQAGAAGYITKSSSREEMIQAIRSVVLGQRHISPEIAKQLAFSSVTRGGSTPFDSLSERELQIVMMVTQGVKVQEIAEKLHLSPKTVNSYRYRIFDKLGINSDVELTHLTLRYGILDSEDIKSQN